MRKIFVLLLLITAIKPIQAQTFFTGTEYGVVGGGSQYFGDLNDNYGFQYVRPVVGAFTRFHLNPYIATRISIDYTHVGYDDAYSSNVFNKTRNLSFQSDIIEGVFQAEFNFFRFSTGELKSRFTPYLTGGLGVFYYNPYTTLNGVKYYLNPLGTEGQYAGVTGRTYNKLSMCFPIGAGIKYWIVPGVNFGVEITDRLTLTDYMDDVSTTYAGADKFPSDPATPSVAYQLQDRSWQVTNEPLGRAGKQRGNSTTKDQYMMFVINLSFQLKTYRCPSWLKEGYYMY
jgi:hypothetical protein